MPDQSQYADVFNNINNQQNTQSDTSAQSNAAEVEYLRSIDKTLKELLKTSKNMSQSAANDSSPTSSDRRKAASLNNSFRDTSRKAKQAYTNSLDNFLDAFEESLFEGLGASNFKSQIKDMLDKLAEDIGVPLQDVPNALGKEVGKALLNTGLGQKLKNATQNIIQNTINNIDRNYEAGKAKYNQSHPFEAAEQAARRNASRSQSNVKQPPRSSTRKNDIIDTFSKGSGMSSNSDPVVALLQHIDISTFGIWDYLKNNNNEATQEYVKNQMSALLGTDGETNPLETALSVVDTGSKAMQMADTANTAATVASGAQAGAALSGIVSALSSAVPALLTIQVIGKLFEPVAEALQKFFGSLMKAANREEESREKRIEEAQKRLEKDVESIIRAPFEILRDAAQEIYDVWDSQLRTITATQGYNKADLQDLISNYSERLRDEGLTSYVSSADITETLAKVLESGLSGQVAEEFAYIATKLNAAIPTQDFFNYAETYASLAANAIANGQSEAQAISYANEQLELFASNVLYASRQLSGGFSTGLQDAQTLFTDAVKIAQASRTGDPSQIAGVLTSISAITGAIAPDLASSMVEAVVSAATGGNSSQLVALRSLAGINASNTEFLRALADDPQGVFSTLFTNLASMQSMSEDAYMEVAEGLSEIFGISMDAFARIDFNYLAQAISNMDVSTSALSENLGLLASGETTTNKEALRMQQVNEYMLEEGLSYVLDNEVARSIQEHMWDEQIAQQMQEATYAVDLTGESMSLLNTIAKFLKSLSPLYWLSKLPNIFKTSDEAAALNANIAEVVKAGQVGGGNYEQYYYLTTRGSSFNLSPSYLQLLGSKDSYLAASNYSFDNPNVWLGDNAFTEAFEQISGRAHELKNEELAHDRSVNSLYRWNTLSKSAAQIISSGTAGALLGLPGSATAGTSATQSASEAAKSAVNARIDELVSNDFISKMVEEGKTFDDWVTSAKNKGISDVESALTDAGYNISDVKNQFSEFEAQAQSKKLYDRQLKEEAYWDRQNKFADTMEEYTVQLIDLSTLSTELLTDILEKNTEFYDAWVDYFVNHTAYNQAYDYSDVERIRNAEKDNSDTAIYALAEALSQNTVDLRDPAVQTNALLSQILLIVQAIMQQNNKSSGGFSLPDTLNALALGITFPNT